MIKRIVIQVPYREEDRLYAGNFEYRTWYITEYISRDIKTQKYKYENVNLLTIELESQVEKLEYKEIYKSISFYLQYQSDNIMPLPEKNFRKEILQIISEAAIEYDKLIPGIKDTINNSIVLFEKGGYKNIWTFKKRRIKGVGSAKLECELNEQYFILSLVIEDKNKEIYRKEILKTLPDSIFYYDEFKELKIDDDELVVINRSDDIMFRLNLLDIDKEPTQKLELKEEDHSVFADPQYCSIPGISY